MTDDERKMLVDIHTALFDTPPGSAKDEKPLIEAMRLMWRAYQRSTWAARTIVWLILTLGALATAVTTVWAVLRGAK